MQTHGRYISDDPAAPGGESEILGPRLSTIHHNMILCNYQCTWPIDHDDGSNHYLDSYNVLWYGGAKNFLGHDKHSMNNLYLYVDAQPYEGQVPPLECCNRLQSSRLNHLPI